MKRIKCGGICLLVYLVLVLNANATVATPPFTGAPLSNVAVLAGTTQTNVNTTVSGGNVVSPSITGPLAFIGAFSSSTASGTVTTDQTALTAAETSAATEAGCTSVGNAITGPVTLVAGLYCTPPAGALLLNGVLTLSGSSTDVWVFQVGSALTAAIGSSVVFQGGASPCNVYWQVGSSAFITTNGPFAGTIMALTSITLGGGTLNGRALAGAEVSISTQESIVSGCSPPLSTIVLSPVNSSIVCGSGSSVTKTALVVSNGIPVAGASVTFKVSGADSFTSSPVLTDASGIATFVFTPSSITSSLGDTIVAMTSISSVTLTSNNTNVTCSGSISRSACLTTPSPTVSVLSVITGPPMQVIFSVLAPGGLVSVVAITPPTTNATVLVPPFDSGTTLAVGVTATKINQRKGATVELFVTDLCGHTTKFDPVFATITIPASKSKSAQLDFDHREVDHFNGIGHTEGTVLLHNGKPGVESLVIRVNWSQFRTQLSDGERKTIDISSALFHGHNTVTVAAIGDPGSFVDLTITDGK